MRIMDPIILEQIHWIPVPIVSLLKVCRWCRSACRTHRRPKKPLQRNKGDYWSFFEKRVHFPTTIILCISFSSRRVSSSLASNDNWISRWKTTSGHSARLPRAVVARASPRNPPNLRPPVSTPSNPLTSFSALFQPRKITRDLIHVLLF